MYKPLEEGSMVLAFKKLMGKKIFNRARFRLMEPQKERLKQIRSFIGKNCMHLNTVPTDLVYILPLVLIRLR